MKNMQIYNISDLINKDFDDEEIDNVSKSLIFSLIIGMFRYIKSKLTDDDIIKLIKTDNWFDNYYWTEYQRNEYKKKLNKIFYNLYRFGPIKCNNSTNEFIMKYGLNIKPTRKRYYKKNFKSNE